MATMKRKLSSIYPFKVGRTPYAERAEGSPVFSFGRESSAQRRLWIPWATSPSGSAMACWQAAADILGFSFINTDTNGVKYVARYTPMAFPGMRPDRLFGSPAGYDNQVFLYASEIPRIEGDRTQGNLQSLATQDSFITKTHAIENNLSLLDGAAENTDGLGLGQFVEAILTVVYTPRTYAIMSDQQLKAANNGSLNESCLLRYVSIKITPITKVQTFKGFSLVHFTANPFRDMAPDGTLNPKPLANDVPVYCHESIVEVKWHQVPAQGIPWEAIWGGIGKTNKAEFGVRGVPGTIDVSFDAGTLLMLYPEFHYQKMINGNWAADITYRFRHYPLGGGANGFFRVSIPGVRDPALANFFIPGIKGGIGVGGITVTPGQDVAVFSSNHGLINGDNVSLVAASTGGSIGSWPITVLTNNTFTLNNTGTGISSDYTLVTHWVISPGYFPTSRSGIANAAGISVDPIFPYFDYSKLFQPE